MDGVARENDDEHHRRDGSHRREEGQRNAHGRRLVLLTVVRAHLLVLKVRRPPLIKGLRHRRKVPAVARCSAPRQGGGVL
eukprot:3609103-Pleurochrysis_carterae.AAC.1